MAPSMITVKFIVLILSLMQSTSYAMDRTLISTINPGCDTCDGNSTLIYVKAIGKHDTIHEIWDFTRGPPTLIFTVAGLNSTINIIWDGSKPDKFLMTELPFYTFATAIDKLYEYNDLADVGQYDWHMPQRIHTLKDVTWRIKNNNFTENEVTIFMEGTLHDHASGVMYVKVELLPFHASAARLPHLIHTANSTLIDVGLVNLTTSDQYNSSRFALHMVLASTDNSKDMMHVVTRKSLDDEHTPGVFEMIEIKTPHTFKSGTGGYVQFRPVAYTQSERGVATSTVVHLTDLERATLTEKSTLKAFFKNSDLDNVLIEDSIISFGEPGDGFYKAHNFTSWTFSVGYGSPPLESFSPFVIIVIAVGLSLPIMLAISGIVYVVVKRMEQRGSPTRLTEED